MKLIVTEVYEVEKIIITCGEATDIFESGKTYRLNNFFWFEEIGEGSIGFVRSMGWIYDQKRNKKIYLCQHIQRESGTKLGA